MIDIEDLSNLMVDGDDLIGILIAGIVVGMIALVAFLAACGVALI